MSSTFFLDAAPGVRLAIEESGDPHGMPVFFFHGWPASRLQGSGFSVEARALGVRIISPDRPGIGLSSFQAGRRLLDWPPLVAQMATLMGIDQFRILAISGGGPYALATAYVMPERVIAVSLVSGAPPLGPDVDKRALLAIYRWLLGAYRHRPAIVRWLFQKVRPIAMLRPPAWTWPLLLRFVPKVDRAALRDPAMFEGCFGCYREAWRGDANGVISDAEVYAHDWGFLPEQVAVPVRLWHGKADRSFSWRLADELARRLPRCETRFVEGEGHYSLPIRHRMEILRDLVTCCAAKEQKR
jgi:pimeloyl-ACP methyl ester carboxylesterase